MLEIRPTIDKQVTAFFVFYLIYKMQVGVGILGFERFITKEAGHDAWISVIISGLTINLLIWMCYKMLGGGGRVRDIISIHQETFGLWIGNALTFLFVIYFLFQSFVLLRTYLEVIQVWMFPGINIPVIMAILLILMYGFISGGFRTLVGFCVIGTLLGLTLLGLKYFPIQEARFYNLTPVFAHSAGDIMRGVKAMALNLLGFEMLLVYYPFLRKPESSQKWAHFGSLFSTMIYVISVVVSLVYYHHDQLKTVIWATLTLWKIVDLPFVERFEYIGISIWLFMILPNACLGVWAASRCMKRMCKVSQRKTVIFFLVLLLVTTFFGKTRQNINEINTLISQIGFYLIYFYLPFLFVVQTIVLKVRGADR
ncbi:GerAB/ArcD/ProY family transporter [Bacillus massiliglaciei]|uniref:GerAB/ArcD/ProY family transporter n=1 Tax=Bacillus massiliglaciei TaxID=1816693 RepID=UPI000B0C3051|nr:GerAB/ArcD/ProY family transporter [Bacillus massiliglaciei]